MPALRTGNHIGLPLQILAKLNHYRGQGIVDKLGSLMDIATDLDLISGADSGDSPTGICRRLKRLT